MLTDADGPTVLDILIAGGHGFSLVFIVTSSIRCSLKIIWEPYNEVINNLPPHCKSGEAIWRARVPLVCLDIVERHYTDHVMRQFGRRQAVPGDTFKDDYTLHRYGRHGNAMTNWPEKHHKYVKLWNERRDFLQESDVHQGRDTTTDDFMAWYQRITRRWIGNVMKFPPDRGIQRTAGLVELLFQGLAECYELFTRSGNQDGMSTCEQLFAETCVELPSIPLPSSLRFDQQAPVVTQKPTDVEMDHAHNMEDTGGEGSRSRRKRSRTATSRRPAIRSTRSEISTSDVPIYMSPHIPCTVEQSSQTPFMPGQPSMSRPLVPFLTLFMTLPGPIPHPLFLSSGYNAPMMDQRPPGRLQSRS